MILILTTNTKNIHVENPVSKSRIKGWERLYFSGHALGFYHEQSRPDRDIFVEILIANIVPGKYGLNN